MAELSVDFHEKQLEIFNSSARFKVVSAGRRGGKTFLSMWTLILKGLASKEKNVLYVAPTLGMAKSIMWADLKNAAAPVTLNIHESDLVLTLINGIKIFLKGSDKPDSLRGIGYSYIVLDEYATMKPATWDMILRPTLADVGGHAMFIGTPEGKNHFYDLWQDAQDLEEWDSFQFNSVDNPLIDPAEIQQAKDSMSTMAFRQEFEASFQTFSGGIFQEDWIKYGEEPTEGSYVIAVDPAGYEAAIVGSKKKQHLDETAIAVVKIYGDKWFVKDIYHGRWSIKETATRIIQAGLDVQATTVGIEKGSLKNAIMPYLEDEMRAKGRWINISTVTHGGKRKTERITWALQGRMEHGKIILNKGDWNHEFTGQLMDFPATGTHDDLIDALAYIDQVSVADFISSIELDEYEELDSYSGY